MTTGLKEPVGAKPDVLKNIEQGAANVQTAVQPLTPVQEKKAP